MHNLSNMPHFISLCPKCKKEFDKFMIKWKKNLI